jgi:hypothetical protein
MRGCPADMASSRVQIAELAGVSRQAVHKAIRAGHLVCGANGLIDPDARAPITAS